jgi:preprotein translocase subunit Sec63
LLSLYRQWRGIGAEAPLSESTEIKSRGDALAVLGLKDDADDEAIKTAYKALMQKIHPDHEGSEWMAAKLNEARDLLLKK